MATRRPRFRTFALVLGSFAVAASALGAADDRSSGGEAIPAPALRELAELRRLTGCRSLPTDDRARELDVLGRRTIEIVGRERGGDGSGPARDLAVFDQAAGRVVSYSCLANASSRASGEAIVSLAAVSNRGDALARALFPGSNLGLESVNRYRTDGTESIYYEARYTTAAGESPFFEAPVRILLNATSGEFFRLDIDPDWFAPPDPPRVRISRKAAERIATVVLRRRDLAPAFGPGAVFGDVASAEMYTVRPNADFGSLPQVAEARARVAWVVPFRVDGGVAAGLHNLFVDAATGRILGGTFGPTAGHPPP